MTALGSFREFLVDCVLDLQGEYSLKSENYVNLPFSGEQGNYDFIRFIK